MKKAKAPGVVRHMKIDGHWRYVPVARQGGQLDFRYVMYKGQRLPGGEAPFHLDFFEDGKRRRPCVGDDVTAVKRALQTQQHVNALRRRDLEVEDAPEIQRRAEGKALGTIVEVYTANKPAGISRSSHIKYRGILRDFNGWAVVRGVTHALMVNDATIVSYIRHLEEKRGLEAHTICDKVSFVTREMTRHGCSFSLRATDLPKVISKEVETYAPEDLKALFAVCRPHEYVLYQTFLQSGMREQEVAFLFVNDILPTQCGLRVSAKPEIGFRPKNYHERVVTVAPWVIEMLLGHCREKGITEGLIFGTMAWDAMGGKGGGKRDNNMLLKLKKIARRGGLNCGRCEGSYEGKRATCATAPICGKFGLHKFRHTFATNALRDRIDLASLQRQMGHEDMNSTKRYLHALKPEELQQQVEVSTLAKMFRPEIPFPTAERSQAVQQSASPAFSPRRPLRRRRPARRLRGLPALARRF